MSIQKKSLIGNMKAAKKAIIATSVSSSSPFVSRVDGQPGLQTTKRGLLETTKRGALETTKRGLLETTKRGLVQTTKKA